MKTIVYHDHCSDGFCSAWVATKALGQVEYLPMSYGRVPGDIVDMLTGREVWVLDFSFPREVMETLIGKCNRFVVLDHHETAMKDCTGIGGEIKFEMDKSGAQMTWEHFHARYDSPDLVKYVQDRDLWTFRLPDSREINAVIGITEKTIEEYDNLHRRLLMDRETMVREGRAIIRMQSRMIAESVKHAFEIRIGADRVRCVNTTSLISETVRELAKGEKYAASFYYNGRWKFSLRSDVNGVNVSEIAKGYGGGGHKHAAGFEVLDISAFLIPGKG